MTFEGVGKTSSLADALSPLDVCVGVGHSACGLSFDTSYWEADVRRLLQALQKLGQVVLFSIVPPTFTSLYSAAHVFARSGAASWPALGSFLIWTFVSGALACCCAVA